MTRPLSSSPTGTRNGGAQGDDFAAGMNAVHFAQRHEQNMMIAKADHFGQREAVVPRGFNAADFADGRQRAPSDSMTRPISCTTRP
jgi:hypothetical protein